MIGVSAADSRDDRESCREAGMDDFVAKPVDLADLRRALAASVVPGGVGPAPAGGDVLDLARLRPRGQLGEGDLLRETVRTYLTELPRRRDALRAALRDDDREAVLQVSHSLRSSSAMLGATQLAQRCAEVEEAARKGAPETLSALSDEVDSVAEKTGAALTRWLG